MAGRLLPMVMLVGLAVGACGSGVGKTTGQAVSPLVMETLYLGQQCGGAAPQPAAQWIGAAGDLSVLWQRLGNRFAGSPRPAPPEVDFAEHGVLLLSMGQRPTGGYGLALRDQAVLVVGHSARVDVQWQEPLPGELVPQVLSSPCLLLRLPRGDFAEVRVVDQHDVERFRVSIF